MFAIAEAIERGYSIDKIYKLTRVNPWFLYKLKNIVEIKEKLRCHKLRNLPSPLLKAAKQKGFSDLQIALLTKDTPAEVRKKRKKIGIVPYVKQIDTLAAEYPASTNYLYLTYNGSEDDIKPSKKKILIHHLYL